MILKFVFSRIPFVLVAIIFAAGSALADEAKDQWIIDFNIGAAAASDNGKYLLAFGGKVGTDESSSQKMIVLDLEKRQLVKAVDFDRPKHFGVGDDRIFIVPKGSNTLKVLRLRDFNEISRIDLDEEVLGMSLVNRRKVGLLLDKGRGRVKSVTYFDRKTLERDTDREVHEEMVGELQDLPWSESLYKTRTELKTRDTDEHFCLVEMPLLQTFSSRSKSSGFPFPETRDRDRTSLSQSRPLRGVVTGRADGLMSGRALEFSESTDFWAWSRSRGGKDQFTLTRHNRFSREVAETWTISRTAEKNLNSLFQFLVFRNDSIVFISNQVLTFIPKEPLTSQNLRFERERIHIYDTSKIVKLRLNCKGGIGKKLWTALGESPHIWIDESSGVLTVDVPQIWAEHLTVASGKKKPRALSANQANAEFKRITGREVPEDKSPFCIPVNLRVEDSRLQRVEVSLYLLVLAPSSEYALAKVVTPLVDGAAAAVGNVLSSKKKPNQVKPAVNEAMDSPLGKRILAAEQKAKAIKSQLNRIEKLVKEINALQRGDR